MPIKNGEKRMHHFGDPCIHCGTPHDEVQPGPCTTAPDRYRFRRLVGSFKPVSGAWVGDSYGYHPHGVIRRGIIFTDHHNVNAYVSAQVILDPDAKIIRPSNGREASICGYEKDAVPRPATGGLLTVYRDGYWVGEDGPWRQIIIDVLADLDREIREIEEQEMAAKVAAKEVAEEAQRQKFTLARAALEAAKKVKT